MRNRARALGCLLVGTSMLSIVQPTSAAAAVQASQAVRFYDIPAQPLGTALSSYAEVSGVDLVANPAAVKGKRSRAIKGNFSPEDALSEILRGTSLDYRMSSNGSVIVGATMGYVPASVPTGSVDGVQLAQNETQASPQQDQATAPQPNPAETQAIVVTGIRASLQQSRDIKRNANGVVDAVSAEQIGKFPDTNLAESLQRIPGVSIERRAGEGTEVTVRGFGPQFNLVTINGRQLATTDVSAVGGDQNVDFSRATSRSFDFSNLASEGVSRLEVYKTGRANVPTGGIGATINIVTARPLEGPAGFRGSIGAKANYDASLKHSLTPEASGVISWSDPNKTIGVSIFGEYSKRKWAAASSTVNDWNITTFANMPGLDNSPDDPATPIDESADNTVVTNAPTDPNQLVAIPNDSRYHYSEFQRERVNVAGTVQFRPIETLTITADGLYARNKVHEQRSDQTNWFNRPFDFVTFDNDPVVATAVYLKEGSRYTVKDLGFEQQYRATKTSLYSIGLNANWEVAPNITLNVDGNTSKSKTTPDAANGASSTLVSIGAPVVDGHSVDFSGDIPEQNWDLDDCVKGNCNGVLDIGDLGTQVQRTNISAQSQKVDQIRADLGWKFGDGMRVDVGASHIQSKMRSTQTQTQQQLGDWGITNVGDVQALAGDLVDQFCLQCRFDHYRPNDALTAFRGNAVDLYNAFAPFYAARGNPINVTGYNDDTVRERVNAIYGMFSWKGDLGTMPAGVAVGARYEQTRVNAHANVVAPTMIVWNSDNDFSRVIDFNNPVFVTRDGTGKYNNFLPSIDFKIEPAHGLIARASASRTLARPDYGNLFVSEQANAPNRPTFLGGIATGSVGDPTLKPLVSTNFDVSLEYYYGRSNYVSAGFFYKNVKNFIGQAVFNENLFGLRDSSSGAPGTLSGTAVTQLNALSIPISDVSLFTYSALLVKYNGDVAAASAEISANLTPTRNVVQTYAETVLAAYDVNPTASDPLFNFAVTTPINNRTGKIHGFEFQVQHFFGNTGFGLAGSLTKVFGDVNFDRGSPPGTNVFALTGLSDSANATAIFEKYGISARVAYNWRGKFLSSINNGGYRNPRYFAPYGTLDASVSYEIGNFAVSLDAQNLLSEPLRVYGRSKRQIFFAQEGHPHFQLGARYKFGGNAPPPPPPPPLPPPPPPPPATQTCPDGSVIEVAASCPAPPPPPPPPPPPATSGERGQ